MYLNPVHQTICVNVINTLPVLLQEYMWYRKHTYKRLDGSSKISERRDMVADFQARSDIFVFLLSTRAGGLGINLTAADTVSGASIYGFSVTLFKHFMPNGISQHYQLDKSNV